MYKIVMFVEKYKFFRVFLCNSIYCEGVLENMSVF